MTLERRRTERRKHLPPVRTELTAALAAARTLLRQNLPSQQVAVVREIERHVMRALQHLGQRR